MINFVVALPCEARPLVQRLALRAETGHPWSIFRNDEARLVVSGVGCVNAAAATGYLAALDGRGVWINFGVAGGGQTIGSLYWINKIGQQFPKRHWYPPRPAWLQWQSASLVTSDVPSDDYHTHTLCDMEAAAFYAVASKFASSEWVHVLKVVSDNSPATRDSLNKTQVETLLNEKGEDIENFALRLKEQFISFRDEPVDVEPWLTHWHFTVTQKNQLAMLLGRWRVLHGVPASMDTFENDGSAKQVLAHLTRRLDNQWRQSCD